MQRWKSTLSKGSREELRLVVPAEIVRKAKLGAGDKVHWEETKDEYVLVIPRADTRVLVCDVTKAEAQAVLTRALGQEEPLGVTYEVVQGKLARTGDFRQVSLEELERWGPTEEQTRVILRIV